ncbi:MAG TPA: C1 family peptidase [Paludibacter sp.]|nr:C1 family peptidase [Paludibacter sp.]
MKILISLLLLLPALAFAAEKDTTEIDSFRFTIIKENKITPVKDQASSGTCWSFSGLGFFEAELLRLGKPEVDLSEMFVIHHSYSDKADKYVRMNGTCNFAGGGSFYDVLYVLQNYGIVPELVMNGLNYGEGKHNHGELDGLTDAYVKTLVKNPNKKLSTAWKKGFDGILNAYLGTCPAEFTVGGKKFTPLAYEQSLGLNLDNYISITSFTHHPFYTKFAIEIPDNWRNSESCNIPLDELKAVIDNALEKGYTLAWAADVSDKGFTRKGIAVNPEVKLSNLPGTDQARWLNIPQKEMEEKIYKIEKPQPEIKVTQESRQAGFDNYSTTDDHGMVIFGTAKDQQGNRYYMVKNSWGTTSKYKGIWYASESYVLDKTIDILVHKDAIPIEILNKMKWR